MHTLLSLQSKLSCQSNGFPVYTTQSGIKLTFQPSEYNHENGRRIADETWKGIAQEYSYLNPDRYDDTSSLSKDWFSIKYNTKRGNNCSYKLLFASMSMHQLCEKESHIQGLIDEVKDFTSSHEYLQYIENHALSSGGPGGSGYKPEYKSFLYSLSVFLSVIAYYKNEYVRTMHHMSLLYKTGYDITALLLDSNNTPHV